MDSKMRLEKSMDLQTLDIENLLTAVGDICSDFGYVTQKTPGKPQSHCSIVGIRFIKM